jgi:hypothetical protein
LTLSWPNGPDLTTKVSDLQDTRFGKQDAPWEGTGNKIVGGDQSFSVGGNGHQDAEKTTRFEHTRASLPTVLLPPPLPRLLPRPLLAPLLDEPRGISLDSGRNR